MLDLIRDMRHDTEAQLEKDERRITMEHCMPEPHRRFRSVLRIIAMVLVGITVAVCFVLVFGFLFMHLWNRLMPALFGLTTITYWQAFGIIIMAKILFGGCGRHGDHAKTDHLHRKVDDKWHLWMGLPSHHHRPVGPDNRRHYHDFWEKQGHTAFEEYVKEQDGKTGNTSKKPDTSLCF